METLLIVTVAISIFLLGVASGAVLENRIMRRKTQIIEIVDKNTIEELFVSLADQIGCVVKESTLVDYEWQDPDKTLEIPAIKEK